MDPDAVKQAIQAITADDALLTEVLLFIRDKYPDAIEDDDDELVLKLDTLSGEQLRDVDEFVAQARFRSFFKNLDNAKQTQLVGLIQHMVPEAVEKETLNVSKLPLDFVKRTVRVPTKVHARTAETKAEAPSRPGNNVDARPGKVEVRPSKTDDRPGTVELRPKKDEPRPYKVVARPDKDGPRTGHKKPEKHACQDGKHVGHKPHKSKDDWSAWSVEDALEWQQEHINDLLAKLKMAVAEMEHLKRAAYDDSEEDYSGD